VNESSLPGRGRAQKFGHNVRGNHALLRAGADIGGEAQFSGGAPDLPNSGGARGPGIFGCPNGQSLCDPMARPPRRRARVGDVFCAKGAADTGLDAVPGPAGGGARCQAKLSPPHMIVIWHPAGLRPERFTSRGGQPPSRCPVIGPQRRPGCIRYIAATLSQGAWPPARLSLLPRTRAQLEAIRRPDPRGCRSVR